MDSLDNPSGLPTLPHRPYFDVYHRFLSTPNHFSTSDLTLHVIGRWPHKEITSPNPKQTSKKETPRRTKINARMRPASGPGAAPRARRFMVFHQLRLQNHHQQPEGTRPLITVIFPVVRHTLARTFAVQLAALVSDKCVPGHPLSLPSFPG